MVIKQAALFQNREEAGKLLGKALRQRYAHRDGILFAIPRGGVVVGFYAAQELNIPLDVVIPKKIGAPSNPEFALGAVMEDGTVFVNPSVPKNPLSQAHINAEAGKKINEIKTKMTLYRGEKPYPDIKHKVVFVVDDGIATGSTVFAVVHYFKKQKPRKIVVSIPVAPTDTIKRLQRVADDMMCLHVPDSFFAVGQFYVDFHQVSDDEVIHFLRLQDEFMREKQ